MLLAVGLLATAGDALAGDWPIYRDDRAGSGSTGELDDDAGREPRDALDRAGARDRQPDRRAGAVYVTGADGALHALDAATGVERWRRYSRVYGPFWCFSTSTTSSWFGPTAAPEVLNGTVYLPGGDGVVFAYDAQTGAILWQTKIADVPTPNEFLWSSGFIVVSRLYVGVASQEDCLLVPGRLIALDLTTGRTHRGTASPCVSSAAPASTMAADLVEKMTFTLQGEGLGVRAAPRVLRRR
jgi:outer membrane protein assembly factor BamB